MNATRTGTLRSRLAPLFVWALWLLLSANLAVFVALYQPNVLSWDQWDFFGPLFSGGSAWDLFHYQHGPHRQGLAFVLTSWVMQATHWDSRWDSLWIASVLAVACALALRLRQVLHGRLTVWDAWIPLLGLALTQHETIVITPNASHSIFPLLLILCAANLWVARRKWVGYPLAGAVSFALTFTGFGLFGGAMVTALLAWTAGRLTVQRRWPAATAAAIGLLVAVTGWIVFAHDYRFNPAVEGFRFPWTPLTDYARFIFLMLVEPAGFGGASAWHFTAGALLAIVAFGAALVAGIYWGRRRGADEQAEVALLLLGAGLLFVANTAVGRIPLGVSAGMSSRYVSLMFPLWLGAYLAGLASGRRAVVLVTSAAVWALALAPYTDLLHRKPHRWPGTLGATNENVALVEAFTTGRAGWAETYLRTGSWQRAQEDYGTAVYPAPAATHMAEKLEFLRQRQLSFFSGSDRMHALLPWLLQDRVVWNGEYPARNIHRVLGNSAQLTFVSRGAGFLHVLVECPEPTQPTETIRIDHDGNTTTWRVERRTVLVLRVDAGFTRLHFSRPGSDMPVTVGPLRLEPTPATGGVLIR